MGRVEFKGEIYRDDRMYVMYICKCTELMCEDLVETTIYHEAPPSDAKWCLVTYRNNERYLAVRADTFDSRHAAEAYRRNVEPTVPLVSLGGCSPNPPLPYDDFVRWKLEEGFQEYDYRKMYAPGGENPREVVIRERQA